MKRLSKIKKQLQGLLIRYLIMILIALSSFWVFYFVFTPITVYSVYFLIMLFFDASLVGNIIFINNKIPIELIPACIAGSAYYLLFILNLSIPKIKLKKRINMILFSFASLLIINILRIFLLIIIYIKDYSFFDITHKLFWYFISIIFVIGIWFTEVRLFKIKDIPFYSDMKFLYKKFISGK